MRVSNLMVVLATVTKTAVGWPVSSTAAQTSSMAFAMPRSRACRFRGRLSRSCRM